MSAELTQASNLAATDQLLRSSSIERNAFKEINLDPLLSPQAYEQQRRCVDLCCVGDAFYTINEPANYDTESVQLSQLKLSEQGVQIESENFPVIFERNRESMRLWGTHELDPNTRTFLLSADVRNNCDKAAWLFRLDQFFKFDDTTSSYPELSTTNNLLTSKHLVGDNNTSPLLTWNLSQRLNLLSLQTSEYSQVQNVLALAMDNNGRREFNKGRIDLVSTVGDQIYINSFETHGAVTSMRIVGDGKLLLWGEGRGKKIGDKIHTPQFHVDALHQTSNGIVAEALTVDTTSLRILASNARADRFLVSRNYAIELCFLNDQNRFETFASFQKSDCFQSVRAIQMTPDGSGAYAILKRAGEELRTLVVFISFAAGDVQVMHCFDDAPELEKMAVSNDGSNILLAGGKKLRLLSR